MGFSKPALQVIEDFARSMEIHQISPASDGSVTFDIERAGLLCFTRAQNEYRILISLKRPHANAQLDDLKRFMALSRWDSFLGVTINAGMSVDGGFVLVASVEEPRLNLQIVEECLDRLIALHDAGQTP